MGEEEEPGVQKHLLTMPPLAPCHSSKGNTYCLEATMATRTMWKDAGDSLWDILPITVLVMSEIKKNQGIDSETRRRNSATQLMLLTV